MHSKGTRELNQHKDTTITGDKWKGFKNFSRICSNLNFESK